MTPPSGPRAAEILVGLSLLLAFSAAFSGFPRYDVVQLAAATFASGAALLIWAVAHARAHDRSPGTTIAITLLWAGMLAWIIAGVIVTGASPEGLDRLALFALPLAPLLWSVRTPDFQPTRVAAVAASIAAIVLAGTCILQMLGIGFPQPIPFSTATGDGLRATLDHPVVGTAAALLLLPTLAIAAIDPANRWPRLTLAGIAAAAAALGLMADTSAIAIAAVGALAGAALLIARGGRGRTLSRYAMLTLGPVIVASLLQATAQPEPGSLDGPRHTSLQEMAIGAWDFGADDPEFRTALATGSWEAAAEALPFGRGPGTFSAEAPLYIGPAAQHRRAMGAVALRDLRAPSPLAELVTEGGLPLALLLLVLFIASAVLLLRRTTAVPASTDEKDASTDDPNALRSPLALHGLVVLAGAFIAAQGLLHAAPFIAAGLLLASIARCTPHPTTTAKVRTPNAAERWIGGVVPVSLLTAALLITQAQALLWGFSAARGDVYMGNTYLAEAQAAYTNAHRWQTRFHSLHNLAQLGSIRSEDRQVASTDDFRAAIRLRPNLLEPRFRLADVMVRQLPAGMDAMTESFRRSADILRHARTLDPSHIETVRLLADIEIMRGNHETSVELLESLIGLDMTARVRTEVLHRLGQLHDDFLDDPARALHYYELAVESARSPSMVNILSERISAMQVWIRTGDRPTPAPAHSHGPFDDHDHGHDHGHDHHHHDHEGHDH